MGLQFSNVQMSEKRRPSIVVRDLSMRGWMAGGIVTRTMALSLKSTGADVSYATSSATRVPYGIPGIILPEPSYFPLEWTLRRLLHWGPKETLVRCTKNSDVVLPVAGSVRVRNIPSVGWIPDFQHIHLPQLFSAKQRAALDHDFETLSTRSDRVLLSSEDARNDFVRHFSHHAGKARVASFPSLFAFEPPSAPAGRVLEKFHLPARFLLVVNQFWRHKNHRAVARALGLLKKMGKPIPLVIAGLPADYRDAENSAISETFQALAEGNVSAQCVFLGKVDREDIVDLLRTATAVVQPSLFEGWNTTVQDAKALGCPVIASSLQVHLEQCPEAVGFFPPDEPEHLARILAEHWDSLPTRPDPASEETSLMREKEFARTYGETLLAICSECVR